MFLIWVKLVYYSYICFKFGKYEKAIDHITKYMNFLFSDGFSDNSYHLIRAIYYYSIGEFELALNDTEFSLSLDLTYSEYDTVKSKLWHSIILYKLGRFDESISYYKKAISEKILIDKANKVQLKYILSPFPGIFPPDSVFNDLEKIIYK